MTSSQAGARSGVPDGEAKGGSSSGRPRAEQAAAAIVGEILSDEVVPAGAYWHRRLAKGVVLRIVDLEGCQAVDTLVYDAADTAVRYNAANTMKLGHSIWGRGTCPRTSTFS